MPCQSSAHVSQWISSVTRHSGKAVVNKASSFVGILAGLAVLAASLGAAPAPARADARIVVDPLTGFAAAGYDPVAYFADRVARPGSAKFEIMWQGAAWRFANEGNQAAFLADPDVYAPAFGGHCAVAVSRGYMAEGNPDIWEVHEGRLYFFHSEVNRQVFLRDPMAIAAASDARWREHRP